MDSRKQREARKRFDPKLEKVVPHMSHVRYIPRPLDVASLNPKRLPDAASGPEWRIITADMFSRYVVSGALRGDVAKSVVDFPMGNIP